MINDHLKNAWLIYILQENSLNSTYMKRSNFSLPGSLISKLFSTSATGVTGDEFGGVIGKTECTRGDLKNHQTCFVLVDF